MNTGLDELQASNTLQVRIACKAHRTAAVQPVEPTETDQLTILQSLIFESYF